MSITLKDFLEAINYRITDGAEYCWSCYGKNARYIDCQSLNSDTFTVSAVFDAESQTVYVVEAWDNINSRYYRWMNPTHIDAYNKECVSRNSNPNEALDGTNYTELEVPEDMLEKISAIVSGKTYDSRVLTPIDINKDDLFTLMGLAHEADMTLNKYVEMVLREKLEEIVEDGTD